MQPNYQSVSVLDLVPFGQTSRAHKFFALRLSHPGWEEWHAGQFLILRPQNFGLEIPWGRAFCICHLTRHNLVIFFEARGKGTERISRLQPGDTVRIWGPLGNWFDIEHDKPTLIIAGGMGIAPFVGYVARHPRPWNISMLFGHRHPAGCYPIDSINEHIPVDSLQEDNSGDLDNFIFSIRERMRDCAEQDGLILACGPTPLLKLIQKFSIELDCRCQISLENRMACGIGACLGCVIGDSQGHFVQTCTHGPVFAAKDVML